MRLDHDSGTIEVGKARRHDPGGNPLANIGDLRKVSWVVANGLLYDTRKLWRSIGFHPYLRRAGVRIHRFHRRGSRACSAREIREQALLASTRRLPDYRQRTGARLFDKSLFVQTDGSADTSEWLPVLQTVSRIQDPGRSLTTRLVRVSAT
jgi:hypothetical protein